MPTFSGITISGGLTLDPPPPPPPAPTAQSFNMNPSGTSGGYIKYSPGTAFEYSAFTFECWFKLLYTPNSRGITGGPGSFYAMVYLASLSLIGLEPMPGSTGAFAFPTMALNTWHNLVITRTTNYSVYDNPWSPPASPGSGYFAVAAWLNGNLATSGVVKNVGGTMYLNRVNNLIGDGQGDFGSNNFNGKLSSLRWSNNCRFFPYTGSPGNLIPVSTIAVPTAAYENDANTVFLLNPSSATPVDGSGLNTITTYSGVTYDSLDGPF